ncbi:unnamed protein product [Bursaphelenchus xylophilus]|uniref:(pine wood nematode) hypothetical protein n=1 Tax=Bursaphelenchus xylophilus TaxID=6326 RepID=A0A1I7RQF4_BURXY|nr:unnamed protein product [Bursaphelenchus xylophilus]CAG9104487.1 unnamed protein product [Bursaphelenchus xylophilus]
MSSAVRCTILIFILTVKIQAFVPGSFEKWTFGTKADFKSIPESDSLLDQLGPKLQDLIPHPWKHLLAQISLSELSGLKDIALQLPQLADLSKFEALLQSKSPVIFGFAKQTFQETKAVFQDKKAQLSPDSLQFFTDLLDINKESLQKSTQLILGLKTEVKDNLKATFPEIAELLKTPAAQKTIPLIINATAP